MRVKSLFTLLCCLGAITVFLAAPAPAHAAKQPLSERLIWIGLGGGGGLSGGELAGVGYLNFTLGFRLLPVVPEFSLREGLRGAGGVDTHIGGVAIGARFLLPKLLIARGYFRLAFSQQHEVQWEHFVDRPLKTLFGVDEGLTHRSGFEAGGGIEAKLGPKGIFGLWLQATAMVFPASEGPPVTAVVEGGLSISLGPKLGKG